MADRLCAVLWHAPKWREISAVLMFGLALAGSSASAQVNEADRLQRCQNNRDRIAEDRRRISEADQYSDERIARARTIMSGLAGEGASVSYYGDALRQYGVEVSPSTAYSGYFYWAEAARRHAHEDIGHWIDHAVRWRKEFDRDEPRLREDISRSETNLAALHCDEPAGNGSPSAVLPNLGGTWYREGNASLPAYISQEGAVLTFSNEHRPPDVSRGHFVSSSEVVADDWQGGLHGLLSADGRRISWTNGSNWMR